MSVGQVIFVSSFLDKESRMGTVDQTGSFWETSVQFRQQNAYTI